MLRAALRLMHALTIVVLGVLICAFIFPFQDNTRRMRWVGWWSRRMLTAIGVTLVGKGEPPTSGTLVVGNHVSWIDILAVNAVAPVRFVSKAEVRKWPVIGWLSVNGGTLFIERGKRRDSIRVVGVIEAALRRGDVVAVFPEGTTNDGRTLLPFHANLLQAAIAAQAPVQPMAIRYTDAVGREAARISGQPVLPTRVTAFEGDITLVRSLFDVLSASGLAVTVTCLEPIDTSDGRETDRRVLSDRARSMIEDALAR